MFYRILVCASLMVALVIVQLIFSQELPRTFKLPDSQPVIDKKIQDQTTLLDLKLRTIYGVDGLPFNRGIGAAGFHRVSGVCKLVAGVDTVILNTSISDGKNDISFTDSTTFHGTAWSMALGNRGNVYTVLPLSPIKFVVVSSDVTDTATILFSLEGD